MNDLDQKVKRAKIIYLNFRYLIIRYNYSYSTQFVASVSNRYPV